MAVIATYAATEHPNHQILRHAAGKTDDFPAMPLCRAGVSISAYVEHLFHKALFLFDNGLHSAQKNGVYAVRGQKESALQQSS